MLVLKMSSQEFSSSQLVARKISLATKKRKVGTEDVVNEEVLPKSSYITKIDDLPGNITSHPLHQTCLEGEQMSAESSSSCTMEFLEKNGNGDENDSFDMFLPVKRCRTSKFFNVGSSLNGPNLNEKNQLKGRNCQPGTNSSYFIDKVKSKQKCITQQQCPICMLDFSNLQLHLKCCMKKNNVTNHQLSVAWMLEEKHRQERLKHGLPTFFESSDEADAEVQRAITLSLGEMNCSQEKILESFKPQKQTKKLKDKSGKLKICSKPLLLRRTQQERENIITEKVAILLMNTHSTESQDHNEHYISDSYLLNSCVCKGSQLWKKAGLLNELEANDFYVNALRKYCSFHTQKTYSTLCDSKESEESEVNKKLKV